MDHSLILYFEESVEGAIRDLQRRIHAVIDNSHTLGNAIRPHLTLTSFEDELDDRILKAFCEFRDLAESGYVELDTLGSFGGGKNVFYISASDRKALDVFFDMKEKAFSGVLLNEMELYRKDTWHPHCTLASRIGDDELASVRTLLGNESIRIAGRISEVALIGGEPVREIRRIQLR